MFELVGGHHEEIQGREDHGKLQAAQLNQRA